MLRPDDFGEASSGRAGTPGPPNSAQAALAFHKHPRPRRNTIRHTEQLMRNACACSKPRNQCLEPLEFDSKIELGLGMVTMLFLPKKAQHDAKTVHWTKGSFPERNLLLGGAGHVLRPQRSVPKEGSGCSARPSWPNKSVAPFSVCEKRSN